MRALLLAALLPLPAAAASKKPSAAAPVKTAVSTAAAGTELPAYAASTAPVTLDLIAARFAELDSRMNSLSADFKQFARLDASDSAQEVEGSVLFKKPDLMRLTHKVPEAQTVVSDGTWLWVHRPATNQVIKTRLEDWRRGEPLAKGLLDFGKSADLLKRYACALSTVSAPGARGDRTFVLTLTPKERAASDADFTLTLKASTRNFFPYEFSLRAGRATIRSVFENVRFNPELPDDDFRFTPPPGADVFTTPPSP